MNKVISDKQNELEQLCHQYHIEKLELFGSAVSDNFDPETSDIDFLVEFNSAGLEHYADNYFGLYTALQSAC